MAQLFGFEIKRTSNQREEQPSFVLPDADDGANIHAGFYSQYLDLNASAKNEYDLVRRYRAVSEHPECDFAIEDIINESINVEAGKETVSIVTDKVPFSPKIKTRIRQEFEQILRLLDFNNKAHDIFRRWYIDGRVYYHKIINESNPKDGIQELRHIDSLKIKRVKKIEKGASKKGTPDIKVVSDHYVFNEKGMDQVASGGAFQITSDSIAFCPSGLYDPTKNIVLSYLHKAIKPVNQLRMIEDAVVNYRISRAPERRIFYIDVGNLPKIKAEQYLKDVMNRYRNKLVYNAATGEIRDDRNQMSMLEDFWLPRREGGRGTEITTLPGGQNLGEVEDIVYFQRKLYRSLNIPVSRLEQESTFNLGRGAEITRDEVKFTKFIQKLRKKFNVLFNDLLKTQLILKGVISEEDWSSIRTNIHYSYLKDGHYAEMRDMDVLRDRLDILNTMEPYIGEWFSKEYVQKHVFRMTDEEIKRMDKQINKEPPPPDDDDDNDRDDSPDRRDDFPDREEEENQLDSQR